MDMSMEKGLFDNILEDLGTEDMFLENPKTEENNKKQTVKRIPKRTKKQNDEIKSENKITGKLQCPIQQKFLREKDKVEISDMDIKVIYKRYYSSKDNNKYNIHNLKERILDDGIDVF